MKTCIKHILYILCIIAGFAALATCTFEDDKNDDEKPNPLEDGIISFKLKLPNNSTRALSLSDENELADVKVLVFKTTGEFLYAAEAMLDNLDNEPMVKRYKAKVSPTKSNEKVDIMTIANAGSILKSIFPNGIPNNEGLTRSDLTDAFTLERPNGWIVRKTDSNYTPVPMWGWAPSVSIDPETGLDEAHATFHLTRMVAKIDVSILGEAKASFKMTGVYLMNRNTVGRLIPNVAAPNLWTGASPKAVTPSLPDDPKPKKGADNYLEYADSYVDRETLEHEVKGVIYAFEAEKGIAYEATKSYEESPCVIIGGKFLNSPNVTYYRVDFEKTNADGKSEHLHILRNYLYSISISRITGPGYPDIDGALKNKPLNIIGEVEPWIDSDMPHQVTDGIHVLSVDRDEFLFYAPGDADSMRIYTDVANGWRINTANAASWLHFVSPAPNDSGYVKGAPLSYVRLTIKPDEIKETDDPRETSFTVEAGALKKSIKVRQSNESPHGLTVSPSVLIFPLSAPDPKTIKVSSMPADAVRSVIYTTTGTVKFLPGKGPQDYHNTKATDFVIQPVAGGSGTVHMIVRTSNAEGLSDTQVVTIIQLNTDSMFGMVGLPAAGYEAADQGDKMIRILSEIPWRLNIMPQNNPSNAPWSGYMLKLTDLGEHPPRPEVLVDYHFELFQNPNYTERVAHVGVISTVPGWEYITFPIKQKGTPPSIRILEPASRHIDFGESNEPVSVKFSTNANWSFSGDSEYSDVILRTDSSDNTEHYGTSIALHSVERTLVFTPRQPPFEVLKAGEIVSTVVKFQTEGHSDSLPLSTDEIVLTRKAKEHCEDIYYRHDENNNLLYVTALTNADWRVVCEELHIDTLIDIDSYDAHVVKFSLPGNEIFEARKYKFSTTSASHKKDTTINIAAATLEFFEVEGFPVPDAYHTIPAQGVPAVGSDYYLIFTGTYKGNFDVQVMRTDPIHGLTEGVLIRNRTNRSDNVIAVQVNISGTDIWEDRIVTFRYRQGTDSKLPWIYARYRNKTEQVQFVQSGYSVQSKTIRESLAPNPTYLEVDLSGYFPSMGLYATYSGKTSDTTNIPRTPLYNVDTDRPEKIWIPAAESWDAQRDVQVFGFDRINQHKELLVTIPQSNLFISPKIISCFSDAIGGPVSIPQDYTGYHSALNVVVDPANSGMVSADDRSNIEEGDRIDLRLTTKRNEGRARTMKVYLKDDAGVTRITLSIYQPGEELYIVQKMEKCGAWPTVADYEAIDLSHNMTETVRDIVLHIERAGYEILDGVEYYIAAEPPVAGKTTHYWGFRKGDSNFSNPSLGCLDEYFVILSHKPKS
ncbi:MAG: hypothetical protein LBD21_02960 [Tannerellaceae bacterium]|jgi:hypothetical protein|nr:hypothetical protein [Tannerellaceae bacterium]